MYDKEGDFQYVGLMCWVSISLDNHLKENFEFCSYVKILLILSFELNFVFEETKKCFISNLH